MLEKFRENWKEDWIHNKWRPMMAWMYLAVCLSDFIFFPFLWMIIQGILKSHPLVPWSAITLQGGGFFHISMGAIVGVSTWSRHKEKLNSISELNLTQEKVVTRDPEL